MSSPITISTASSSKNTEKYNSSSSKSSATAAVTTARHTRTKRNAHNNNNNNNSLPSTSTPTSRAPSPTHSVISTSGGSVVGEDEDKEWISVAPKKRRGSRPSSSGNRPSMSPRKNVIALGPRPEIEKHTNGARFFPFQPVPQGVYSIDVLLHLSQSPLTKNSLSEEKLERVKAVMEDIDFKWQDPKVKKRMEKKRAQRQAEKKAGSLSPQATSESSSASVSVNGDEVTLASETSQLPKPFESTQTQTTSTSNQKKDNANAFRRRRTGRRSVEGKQRPTCNGRSFRGRWGWPQVPEVPFVRNML